MKPRPHPRLWPLLLVPCLAHAADAPAPASASAPKADIPKQTRPASPVSTHISEAIRARLPAYTPAPPTPPPPPLSALGAASPTDTPIILDRVIVTEKPVPTMSAFQMLTPAGQAAYLQKLFPGAVVPGPDPLTESTPNYAAQMHRDKVRLEKLRTFTETAEAFRAGGDLAASKRLTEEMQRALYRAYDWRDERLDRAYNRDRR